MRWCFTCSEYPCGAFPPGEGKFDNIRVKALNHVARDEGLGRLAEHLARNYEAGIVYHRTGGLSGGYDLPDLEQAIHLIRHGRAQT